MVKPACPFAKLLGILRNP